MFLLAVSYEDSSIIVFDLASRAILSDLRVTNMFAKIAFLKFDLLRDARLVVGMEDGAILVYSSSSSSHDRFLREWTTRLLPRLPSVEPLGRVERADWSSSGNFLRACGGGQEKGRNDEMGRGEEKGRGESGSRRDWLAVWRLPQGEEAAVLVLARASGSQKIFEAADFYALRKVMEMKWYVLLAAGNLSVPPCSIIQFQVVLVEFSSTDGDCGAFANSGGSIFLLRKLKKNEAAKSKNGRRDGKKLLFASFMRPPGQMVSGVIMGKKDQLFTWSKQEGCIFQWTRR
ncbi:hypothetical protein GUITHDRAFT_152871 [Guillardia theta CCMP2712]|uniref:Uncharacterized protein n=1 Tax=Guillardia theta (strain CCMP2712) TaxID=905079 RepID=L1J947_GUITC|nr:hypothetical protein GUITHDRAFT_152871 [Guillardia theta CCMP2712]EKX44822.1 hypothetical protein GUITHDRAFT_152871 [Guillardia theta CCMP2712]|eukprot:XP_005831802.1 hypothetical protein GUITHDRAFT_152871 [Guillardia theta CCMP2712]